MSTSLFNRYGNNNPMPNNNGSVGGLLGVILNQFNQVQKDPGKILDILFNNGKITQQQYNSLQPIKDNPQKIVQYLLQNGNGDQIRNASKFANQQFM